MVKAGRCVGFLPAHTRFDDWIWAMYASYVTLVTAQGNRSTARRPQPLAAAARLGPCPLLSLSAGSCGRPTEVCCATSLAHKAVAQWVNTPVRAFTRRPARGRTLQPNPAPRRFLRCRSFRHHLQERLHATDLPVVAFGQRCAPAPAPHVQASTREATALPCSTGPGLIAG